MLVHAFVSLTVISPDVDIKYIGGADPVMVLLDAEYQEVEVGGQSLNLAMVDFW